MRNILKGDFGQFKIKGGKRVRKGVAIIATGEGAAGNLPMDNTISFKENPIITILNKPENISKSSSFQEHMEAALKMFSWNMTNLVISVGDSDWTVYSFNGSYPTYEENEKFKDNILHCLIPKIAAPVRPPRLKDFEIREEAFDIEDEFHLPYAKDLVEGGKLLAKTNLYPTQKSIDDLNFRNSFYRWVGSIHLDKRTGMSYGFLARQLPVQLVKPKKANDLQTNDEIVKVNNKLYVRIVVNNEDLFWEVPDVWILTSRSGSDKTNLDLKNDIIKMGLVNGQWILETPKGVKMKDNYRPSFDSGVILAHAVANAIFASVLKYSKLEADFPWVLEKSGRALAHWHGYFCPEFVPDGYWIYGNNNPPVSCSSPQAAIYAFRGKEDAVLKSLSEGKEFLGDIQIEPQHGINVIYKSLRELANFLLSNPKISKLGDEYLKLY